MVYSISYDLHEYGQKYDELHKLIKKVSTNNNWCHILESTYLIYSDKTSEQIYNFLSSALDKNDCIFITQLTSNYIGCINKDAIAYVENLMSLA